jgi:hypothetical protein
MISLTGYPKYQIRLYNRIKYNKYTPKHGENKPSHLQSKISVLSQRICVSVEQLEQIISRSVLSFELVIHLSLCTWGIMALVSHLDYMQCQHMKVAHSLIACLI